MPGVVLPNYLTIKQIVDEWIDSTLDKAHEGLLLSGQAVPHMVAENFRVIGAHRDEFSTLCHQDLLDRPDPYIYRHTLSSIKELGIFNNNRHQPHFFAGAAALLKAWIEYGFEESAEGHGPENGGSSPRRFFRAGKRGV